MFFVDLLTTTLAERSKSLSEQKSLNARLGHSAEEDAVLECGHLLRQALQFKSSPSGDMFRTKCMRTFLS